MASAGQYVIDKLKSVDNCQSSCNCCKSLQSQINQLKAEIKSIPRINQQEIIKKTEASLTPKLPGLVLPLINLKINPFKAVQAKQLADQKQLLSKIVNNEKASKAAAELAKRAEIKQLTKNREFLNKILNNQKATRIAANTAKVAEVKQAVKNKELLSKIFKAESAARTATGVATSAGKKAGSALAKIATIVVQLAGFGVAVGTLKLVETRFNQQDRENQALSRDLSKSLGLINQNRALIKQNDADIDNNKKRIGDVSDAAYSAQKQATKAREIGEQAELSAKKANQKSDKNSRLIEGLDAGLKGFIFRMNPLIPVILNNEKIAREASKKANEALKGANQANQKAGNTLTQVKEIEKINKNPGRDNNVNNSKLDQLLRKTNGNSNKLSKLIGLTTPILPAIGKIDNKLGTIEKKFGGIDNSVRNLPNSQAFKKSVGSATCKTLNTDSCTSRLREDIKRHDTANGNILLKKLGSKINGITNGFNAGANTLQISLLNTINKKMGEQIPGGISGKLKALGSWLHLDRALNLITTATTIHNAAMLSNQIGSTLGSATANILAVIGIKDDNGSPIDVGKIINGTIEKLIISVIGKANYTALTLEWAKANRIYQAGANIFNSVRSMMDSVRNISEFIAENTGRIGNALKRFAVIGGDAFKWMPEQVDSRSIWVQRLENLEETASGIEMITSEVLSITENVNEIKKQTEIFEKSISESPTKKQTENIAKSEKESEAKDTSKSPKIPQSAERNP